MVFLFFLYKQIYNFYSQRNVYFWKNRLLAFLNFDFWLFVYKPRLEFPNVKIDHELFRVKNGCLIQTLPLFLLQFNRFSRIQLSPFTSSLRSNPHSRLVFTRAIKFISPKLFRKLVVSPSPHLKNNQKISQNRISEATFNPTLNLSFTYELAP